MDLLSELQSEIERQSLPSGGWSSGSGSRAGIETTCYALMALGDAHAQTARKAVDLLLRLQNPDGSWPAFDGDDPEGCWVTALAVIALRYTRSPSAPTENALHWLTDNRGREGHWLWKWKFRTVDRRVQFNPDKYGWCWFPGTVSWVIPTAISLIALRQAFPCCATQKVSDRIRLGTEMLRDRACSQGGWNAGNGIVFGSPLQAHVDTTAIALLALAEDSQPDTSHALAWLRNASTACPSAYSLAWSALALLLHHDQTAGGSIERLIADVSSGGPTLKIDTLSLATIAIKAFEGYHNPFEVRI